MKLDKIKSIKDLRKRKYTIAKRTKKYEEWIEEDIYDLTHPISSGVFSFGGNGCSGGAPTSKIFKLFTNAKRVGEMVRLGFSIFQDYKR